MEGLEVSIRSVDAVLKNSLLGKVLVEGILSTHVGCVDLRERGLKLGFVS